MTKQGPCPMPARMEPRAQGGGGRLECFDSLVVSAEDLESWSVQDADPVPVKSANEGTFVIGFCAGMTAAANRATWASPASRQVLFADALQLMLVRTSKKPQSSHV
jgi:hypothetical protein